MERDTMILPSQTAASILARAVSIDASADGPSVAQLRSAAIDAGISSAAFDTALAEFQKHGFPELIRPTPWWVSLCMIGVTDRRTAMVFYWCFALLMVGAPVASVLLPHGVSMGARLSLPLLGSSFAFFSLWSTSRAVRWLDQHGWQRVR